MRKALLLGLAVAALAITPARAQQSLTRFFQSANLVPLAQSPTVVNLIAQSTTRKPMLSVNAFDNFFLINGPGKLVVNFNKNLQNKGQVPISWIGVLQYSNHEVLYDIQRGFDQVKVHYNMPNARAARVTVYKTINTHQLVFNYAVQTTSSLKCREYLYTPATNGIQLGMMTRCYFSLLPVFGPSSGGHI